MHANASFVVHFSAFFARKQAVGVDLFVMFVYLLARIYRVDSANEGKNK